MPSALSRRTPSPFEYVLISRAVSWAGNAVSAVALPILMFQETGSASLSGLLAVCEAAPYLLLGLPAGALVDRWDQRRTMTVTSWLSAAATATIPLAAVAGVLTPVHLLVVATLLAVLFVFFDAASFGAVPALVGRDGIARATAPDAHREHRGGHHRPRRRRCPDRGHRRRLDPGAGFRQLGRRRRAPAARQLDAAGPPCAQRHPRTTLAAGILALLGWQAMNSLVSLNGIVVRQSLTPSPLQGRVNTTARMIAWGGQPFGAGIGGLWADAFGVRAAILIAGGGVLLSLTGGLLSSLPRSGTLGRLRSATEAKDYSPAP